MASPATQQAPARNQAAVSPPVVSPGKDAPEVSKQLPQNLAQVFGVKEEELTPAQDQTPDIEHVEIPHTELRVGDITTGLNETVADAASQSIAPRYSKSGKILEWLKKRWQKQYPDKEIVEK